MRLLDHIQQTFRCSVLTVKVRYNLFYLLYVHKQLNIARAWKLSLQVDTIITEWGSIQ